MDLAHAYVAQGKSGLLKIGYTNNPERRLRLLKKEFAAKGCELVTFEPCAQCPNAWAVERRLIMFCRDRYQKHSGFEWFSGADFDAVKAVAVAETAAIQHWKPHPKPTAEEREQWRIAGEERRQRRAEAKLRRQQSLAECAKRSAQRKLLRARAERAFSALIDFALGSNRSAAHG